MDDLRTKVIEAVGVRVQTDDVPINIIAAYFPGGRSKEDRVNFKRDIGTLTRQSGAYFIVGDLNSRHRMWNCTRANQTGNILMNLFRSSDFFIHAPTTPTYVPRGRARPSVIDLVLSNNRVNMSVPKVHQELSSDHLPVTFEIDCNIQAESQAKRVRCYDRADWVRFQREVGGKLDVTVESLNNIQTTAEIDASVRRFTSAVLEAEDVAVPWAEYNPQKVVLPDGVRLLITLRNTRRRQFIRSRDPVLGLIVETLNQRIQKECSKLKYKNFGDTVRDIANGHKKFWKISKLVRNKVKHNPPFRIDDGLVISPAEKARVLAESFAKAHDNTLPGDPSVNDEVARSMSAVTEANESNDTHKAERD
ncbi:uncharacterized protein LOC120420069 [Culex pipiens pallens]|uniref:uncharacterized protein LOC120420069 n=1 Tax=Culex pipiens pallens TaxID=42434 RepID=UPI001954DC8F|nr:uncharacterized protein LOC120420069 [Culex pipiens pallens]